MCSGYFLADFVDIVINGKSREYWEIFIHHFAVRVPINSHYIYILHIMLLLSGLNLQSRLDAHSTRLSIQSMWIADYP